MFLSSMFLAIVFCFWLTQFAGIEHPLLNVALFLACVQWMMTYMWYHYISKRWTILWSPLVEELVQEDVELQPLHDPEQKHTSSI